MMMMMIPVAKELAGVALATDTPRVGEGERPVAAYRESVGARTLRLSRGPHAEGRRAAQHDRSRSELVPGQRSRASILPTPLLRHTGGLGAPAPDPRLAAAAAAAAALRTRARSCPPYSRGDGLCTESMYVASISY